MYEDVLAEVKAEGAKKATEYGEVLPFSEIPYERAEEATANTLWKWIGTRANDVFIPPVFPDEPGNPLKKIYTKVVSKITRCVTFPLSKKVTKTNEALRDCLDDVAGVIEEQQKEILELRKRIEALEEHKEAGK